MSEFWRFYSNMKKKTLSLLLALALLTGLLPGGASAFSDISDPNTALAAAALESMGIVTGITANSYYPDSRLTRAQFCTLAVRAMGLDSRAAASGYKALFSDAKPGAWYTGYVNLAYEKGVISGYGNGRFGPDDGVTYGQAVTILLRLLGYTSEEIGRVWPADYVNYAHELGLDDGLSLNAGSVVTRGQAAVLLYNTLGTEVSSGDRAYYETISGVVSTETVIVLDNNTSSGGASGQLTVCGVGGSDSVISHYAQKLKVPDELVGCLGELMLNSAGKAVGFMPSGTYLDVTVSSAKASSLTAASGMVYRIGSGAKVIYNGSVYVYGSSGFLQVDARKGRTVRLYYGDNGAISHIYISTGTAGSGTQAAVAETKGPGSELARKLGIAGAGYAISKNGSPAMAAGLAQYDAAYYDAATKTLRVSDYKITGYLASASPSLGAAETITVAGCVLEVLESAWDSLDSLTLGDSVTLLLTDNGRVAAAYASSKVSAEMLGVLSLDGSSVTLCGSGLTLSAGTVNAAANLRGSLVRVYMSSRTALSCSSPVASTTGTLNLTDKMLDSTALAPGCVIFEWAGSGYVYSLSGTQGASSFDFNEINWTNTLTSSYISYSHRNSAGQIDILLLRDVTGNCYNYGQIRLYTGTAGINLGSGDMPAYNDALTLENSSGLSARYICTQSAQNGYSGTALSVYDSSYLRVAAIAGLTAAAGADGDDFYKSGDNWLVTAQGYELPISSDVQVHFRSFEGWYAGEEGLVAALSSGRSMTLYYDRSLSSGAQVRVIAVG